MKNKVQLFAALAMVLGATSLKAQMNVGATTAPAAGTMLQVTTNGSNSGLSVGYAVAPPTDGANIKGNVGIGTSAAGARLDVLGNTSDNTANSLLVRNLAGTRLLAVRNDGVVGVGTGLSSIVNTLNVGNNLSVGSGYTNSAAPTNGAIIQGNVGIGTIAPNTSLDVRGNGLFTNTSAAGLSNILASVGSNILNVFSPTAAMELALHQKQP